LSRQARRQARNQQGSNRGRENHAPHAALNVNVMVRE
jgi:hypothetical protein